jgi:hypothetical protein
MTPLGSAFQMAAAELGFATASRVFLEQAEGPDATARLEAELASVFPVFGSVLDQRRAAPLPPPRVQSLAPLFSRVSRLVVVGLEAAWMDALTELDLEIGWIPPEHPEGDEERVLRNWGGRVQKVTTLSRWAGEESALLTFSYGRLGQRLAVRPAWLRVYGPDVRAWFRHLIAWDVIGTPLQRYPRWMVGVPRTDFTVEVLP